MDDDAARLSGAECLDLLDRLFPGGPGASGLNPARLGLALWDVFSDNNDVLAADGREACLGSFRASAGFLADWLNLRVPGARFSYLDFYMGTVWVEGMEDPEPLYRAIFGRLRAAGGDWRYVLSRPVPIRVARPPESYDPSRTFAEEQEVDSLAAWLDEIAESMRERLRAGPPPAIIRAYRCVYGRDPKGWPPV